MTPKCIYCGFEQVAPFHKEHVVPRGLGCFRDAQGMELCITDRVCNACNQAVDNCDGELCYAGPEAMLRMRIGIKGRKRKSKSWNPFHRNPFSKEPIVMKGKRSGKNEEDFWEVDPETGHAIEKRSAVFTHPKTGQRMEVPIERGMSKKQLVSMMEEKGYPGGEYPWEMFCSDEDKEWIKELLGTDYERIQWQDRRGLPSTDKIDIEAVATITDKHHRGIAKIAFSYMMHFKPLGITGAEDSFEPLRRFIRYGEGHPNNFVRMAKREIIEGLGKYVGLSDYGHIVTCSVGKIVTSYVHIFTGRELGHKPYEVCLGKYPLKVQALRENIGHWFRITKDCRSATDNGDIIPLFSPTRIAFPRY